MTFEPKANEPKPNEDEPKSQSFAGQALLFAGQALLNELLQALPVISSAANPTVKAVKALHTASHKQEQGQLLLLEGWHLLEEALLAGLTLKALFLREGVVLPAWVSHSETKHEQRLAAALLLALQQAEENTSFHSTSFYSASVGEKAMAALCSTSSAAPVAAVFQAPKPVSLQELWQQHLVQHEGELPQRLLLVLDGLQDAGNVGTLLRSAQAFNALGVVVLEGCAHLYSPKVLRSSAGVGLRLPVVFLQGSTAQALAELAAQGWEVLLTGLPSALKQTPSTSTQSTAQTTTQSTTSTSQSTKPYALVLGQEGQGLRIEASTWQAYHSLVVPMAEGVDSLNVAVCGSILLADWFRGQRFALYPKQAASHSLKHEADLV